MAAELEPFVEKLRRKYPPHGDGPFVPTREELAEEWQRLKTERPNWTTQELTHFEKIWRWFTVERLKLASESYENTRGRAQPYPPRIERNSERITAAIQKLERDYLAAGRFAEVKQAKQAASARQQLEQKRKAAEPLNVAKDDYQAMWRAMEQAAREWSSSIKLEAKPGTNRQNRVLARAYAQVYGITLTDDNDASAPLTAAELAQLPALCREIRARHSDAPPESPQATAERQRAERELQARETRERAERERKAAEAREQAERERKAAEARERVERERRAAEERRLNALPPFRRRCRVYADELQESLALTPNPYSNADQRRLASLVVLIAHIATPEGECEAAIAACDRIRARVGVSAGRGR